MRRREIRYPMARERLHANPDPFGMPEGAHLVPTWKPPRKKPGPPIRGPADVAELFVGLEVAPVERFVTVLLDVKNRVIGAVLVSQGTITDAEVHPREVFAPAIAARAVGVVLVHNHPSGSAEPSAADRTVSLRLAIAGRIIGIPILDHVIIGHAGAYTSLRQVNELPSDSELNRVVDGVLK